MMEQNRLSHSARTIILLAILAVLPPRPTSSSASRSFRMTADPDWDAVNGYTF